MSFSSASLTMNNEENSLLMEGSLPHLTEELSTTNGNKIEDDTNVLMSFARDYEVQDIQHEASIRDDLRLLSRKLQQQQQQQNSKIPTFQTPLQKSKQQPKNFTPHDLLKKLSKTISPLNQKERASAKQPLKSNEIATTQRFQSPNFVSPKLNDTYNPGKAAQNPEEKENDHGDRLYMAMTEVINNVSNVVNIQSDNLSVKFVPHFNVSELEKEIKKVVHEQKQDYEKKQRLLKQAEEISEKTLSAGKDLNILKKEYLLKDEEEQKMNNKLDELKKEIEKLKTELKEKERKMNQAGIDPKDPTNPIKFLGIFPKSFQWPIILLIFLFLEVLTVALIFGKYQNYIQHLENALLYNVDPFEFFDPNQPMTLWQRFFGNN